MEIDDDSREQMLNHAIQDLMDNGPVNDYLQQMPMAVMDFAISSMALNKTMENQ